MVQEGAGDRGAEITEGLLSLILPDKNGVPNWLPRLTREPFESGRTMVSKKRRYKRDLRTQP